MELPEIDVFSLFIPAAGLYLLWIAIFGKGKLLQNEHPKCSPEKYRFWMRILAAVSGLLLLVKGVLEIFGVVKVGTFLSGFLWVLGLVALIGMMAFSVVMTDRQKAREAADEDECEMLRLAACLEEHYPHSMANAVVEEAKKRGSSGSSRQTGSRMPEDAFSFGREEATAKTNEHTGDAK